MNRKRKIVVVSAIGLVVLGLTTGWDVLAGDIWPPEPYQVYSAAGAWSETSDLDEPGHITIVTLSPEDPRTGTGSVLVTEINTDPTFGGQIPEATSVTAWFGTYVKTGPNTGRSKVVRYVRKDEKSKPVILDIHVVETALTQTSPDTIETVGIWLAYSPDSDKDGDGLPDADEQPHLSLPITQYLKRI